MKGIESLNYNDNKNESYIKTNKEDIISFENLEK